MLSLVLWVLIFMLIFTSHHVWCIIIFVALRLIVPFLIFIPWGRCSWYSNTEAQRYTDTQREMLPLFENSRLCRKNLAKKHSAKSLIPVSSPLLLLCQHLWAGIVWVVTPIIQENTTAASCALTAAINRSDEMMLWQRAKWPLWLGP